MKLKILRIMAIIIGLIGTTLFNRFMEGGALFMTLVLISLLISIYHIVKSIINNTENSILVTGDEGLYERCREDYKKNWRGSGAFDIDKRITQKMDDAKFELASMTPDYN